MTQSFSSELVYFSSDTQQNILFVSPKILIVEALARMSQAQSSCVLVVDQDQLTGIFTERDVVKAIATYADLDHLAIAEVMSHPVITISDKQAKDLFIVLDQFRQHQIRHLPVINTQEQIIGIITPHSIREQLRPFDLLKFKRVEEAMETQVVHAPLTASLQQVTQLMTKRQVSCVVITEGRVEGAVMPVGIITERDIVQFRVLHLDFEQTPMAQVMSTPLFTIQPQDSLWTVHREMQQRRTRRLVVAEKTGELAGIITQTSILRVLDPLELAATIQTLQQKIDEGTDQLKQAVAYGRQLFESLAESEARYRAVVESQTELVCRFVPDGRLTFVNDAYCRYFGKSRDALMSENFASDLTDSDRHLVITQLATLTPDQPTILLETAAILLDKTLAWQQWSCCAIFDGQGQLIEYQAVGRDISDRKRSEAERQKAEARLKLSLQEKEVLLQELKHRVKNNLQVITGLLDLQINRVTEPRSKIFLESSRDRIQSMLMVHENLYQFQSFNQQNFTSYVSRLVKNLVTTYAKSPQNIALEIAIDPTISLTLDQATYCGMIVNELVTNVLKYGLHDDRSGYITISLAASADQQLSLVVANDGDRLPTNFSLENLSSVGLKLVIALAEGLNGTLTFERGDKTTFKVLFPKIEQT
jgi:PAS domain S-box-containing protein